MTTNNRTCQQCNQTKPITEYYEFYRKGHTFHRLKCKLCCCANARQATPEAHARRRAHAKDYYLRHKKQYAAHAVQWRKDNREKWLEVTRRQRIKKKNQIKNNTEIISTPLENKCK